MNSHQKDLLRAEGYANGRRKGREEVLSQLEIKLLDGTESNLIRAAAAKRIRETLKEMDKIMKRAGEGGESK